MADAYETWAKGMRILPGQWRPHYPFEQIAWISPPWPSHDYIWLDFPEAIFTNIGLLYLSHVNPAHPVAFPDLPNVPWQVVEGGVCFERTLPNGFRFGGSVRLDGSAPAAIPGTVSLDLYFHNGCGQLIKDVRLQTCAYLRGIKEFADFTQANKFVHTPERGWAPFEVARSDGNETGRYRLGFGWGPKAADLPVLVTRSNAAERWTAMTWYDDTYSMVGNPHHPCMHADPFIAELRPGERKTLRGEIMFFEGTLEAFGEWFVKRTLH